MYTQKLIGMTAVTSIHAGASTNDAAVDLPIQREAHTDWPVVFGSGMKGALRAHAQDNQQESDWIADVFGPDTNAASDHAGALLVSDARLLLLPVRSLTSHFKWVTCPAIIKRVQKDTERAGMPVKVELAAFSQDQVLVCSESKDEFLFLEEFRYQQKAQDLTGVIELLSPFMSADVKEIEDKLAIVSDDQFRYLSRAATPVNAHIAIENETKTVKKGALWYEESLPPDSIFYLLVAATNGRKSQASSQSLMDGLMGLLDDSPFLQVGGNLTTGMGWFECKPLEGA